MREHVLTRAGTCKWVGCLGDKRKSGPFRSRFHPVPDDPVGYFRTVKPSFSKKEAALADFRNSR